MSVFLMQIVIVCMQFSAQLKSLGNTVQQKCSVFAHLARLSDFSKWAYVVVADQFYLYKIREKAYDS